MLWFFLHPSLWLYNIRYKNKNNEYIYIYVYIYCHIYINILSSRDRLFHCITTLQCGKTRRMLQAGISCKSSEL